MKKYLFYAASALAVVGCSNDDYLGNNDGNGNGQNADNAAINFASGAGKLTRTTANSGKVYEMLDGQFKVYGVKSGATAGQEFQDVFKDYSVWYVDDNDKHTTSNSKGWEYVGAKNATDLGTGKITLSNDQTIKYWDYSAADYRFVAGSPIDKVTFETDETTKAITSAKISQFKGHITPNNVTEDEGTTTTTTAEAPVYIATPKIVEKNETNYKEPVTLTFVRQHAMVRVGIYETIPGYNISSISFYGYEAATAEGGTEAADLKVQTTNANNITLTSATSNYFIGGTGTGEVTYDWNTTNGGPKATLKVTGSTTKSKNWYAGQLKSGVQATSAAETNIAKLYGTDKDMDSKNGYFAVLPTQETNASPLIIKCNYTLTSVDGSNEKIYVTGATAAIPAEFSKWEPNTLYTYLFKISDNTNGTTGGTDNPVGLYPITFDAAVADNLIGTTTTFSAPSITTYQEGSVSGNTIKYKAGEIKIYVCNEKGEKQNLSTSDDANIAVYKLTKKRAEADLQVDAIKDVEIKDDNKQNNVTVNDNVATFTAEASSYYAIQYKSTVGGSTVYTYKVVEVVASTTTGN